MTSYVGLCGGRHCTLASFALRFAVCEVSGCKSMFWVFEDFLEVVLAKFLYVRFDGC